VPDALAAARTDVDVLDYYESDLVDEPLDRQARLVALELLEKTASQ
jgi:hypothetical protein